jgi:hypothetical protein
MPHTHPDYYRVLPELEQLKQVEAHEKNVAMVAAFMMEGFMGEGIDYYDVIAAWNQGAAELIHSLTQYAPFMQELYEAECAKRDDSAPGVYVYEVTSVFGKWFYDCIMADAKLKQGTDSWVEAPNSEVCEAWIRTKTEEFFGQ